jgi:3-methyladenine DNA glycosylase AlkD
MRKRKSTLKIVGEEQCKMHKITANALEKLADKTQQSRQGNMAKYNVKVHFRKAELYATLTITKTLILIEPDDVKRHGIFLPNLNLKNTTNLGQEAEYFIEVK